MSNVVLDLLDPHIDSVQAIRSGLSVDKALALGKLLKLQEAELAHLIGISHRTLLRHKQKKQALQPVTSDRVYRLARILALAVDVFEDNLDVARTWLERPNRVLKGASPLEMLDTDAGAEQVTQLLNRIEYGVYS